MDKRELVIDADQTELLARNVPEDFNKFVRKQAKNRNDSGSRNHNNETLIRLGEVVGSLKITDDSNFMIRNRIVNRLTTVLDVYLAMKASVDQLINTKEVLREILRLDAAIESVALSLKNDARDSLIVERNALSDISEIGNDSKSFCDANQIDERIAIAHQMILHMSTELKYVRSYFKYKGGLVSGSGRRKNDYSIHYLVFALGEVFQDVKGSDASVMVSFNDDDLPTSKFWSFFEAFCQNCDPELIRVFEGNFAQTVKTMCRRYQKADYSVKQLTNKPDTQTLLDFMVAVHKVKSAR